MNATQTMQAPRTKSQKFAVSFGSTDDMQFNRPEPLEPIYSQRAASDSESQSQSSLFSDNQSAARSIQSSRSHNFRLKLKGKNITSLKFLSKFIREFPYISDIDIGDNKIAEQDYSEFAATLEANRYI